MRLKVEQKVTDIITGRKGVVLAKTIFLNGCVRVGVAFKDKKSEKTEDEWHDEIRFVPKEQRERTPIPQELGQKAHDSITNFKGTTTAVMEQFNGSIRYLLTAAKVSPENGEPIEHWFDEGRVVGLKKSAKMLKTAKERDGGPGPTPTRRECPRM